MQYPTTGVPVSSGTTNFNTDGSDYIPVLYAQGTQVKYYDTSVLMEIANTKYEGLIKEKGNKVVIRTRPDIAIFDYSDNMDLEYEVPSSQSVELDIDRAKAYAFMVPKVEGHQSDIVLEDEFHADSARQMEIAIDTEVLAEIPADAGLYNKGNTAGRISGDILMGDIAVGQKPRQGTASNCIDIVEDQRLVLTENTVPDDGNRWGVYPAWFCSLIRRNDIVKKANESGMAGESLIFNNKFVSEVAGLNIFESNLLSFVTVSDGANDHKVWSCPFGHEDGLTMAVQLTTAESVQLQNTFGRAYRGLYVYGFKVIKPQAFGRLYLSKDDFTVA